MAKRKTFAFPLYFTLLLLLSTALLPISDADIRLRSSKSSGGVVPAQELWCVAKNNAEDSALQAAIDWACGAGGADCAPIQQGGPCYDPSNLQNTASYVFNDYFLKHGLSDDSCNFDNTAAITSLNPSQSFSLYFLPWLFLLLFLYFMFLAVIFFWISFIFWDPEFLDATIIELELEAMTFLFQDVIWFAYSCASHSFEFQVMIIANSHPGNLAEICRFWFLYLVPKSFLHVIC